MNPRSHLCDVIALEFCGGIQEILTDCFAVGDDKYIQGDQYDRCQEQTDRTAQGDGVSGLQPSLRR